MNDRPGRRTSRLALLGLALLATGCVTVPRQPLPTGVSAFKIDVEASEIDATVAGAGEAEALRQKVADLLDKWSRESYAASVPVPARFRITAGEDATLYPWAFLPLIQIMFPMGHGTIGVQITFELNGRVYSGSASEGYLVGMGYSDERDLALEAALRRALEDGVHRGPQMAGGAR